MDMTRVVMPHPGRETGERNFELGSYPHRWDRNPAGRERLGENGYLKPTSRPA
jgi:hypothetical protein